MFGPASVRPSINAVGFLRKAEGADNPASDAPPVARADGSESEEDDDDDGDQTMAESFLDQIVTRARGAHAGAGVAGSAPMLAQFHHLLPEPGRRLALWTVYRCRKEMGNPGLEVCRLLSYVHAHQIYCMLTSSPVARCLWLCAWQRVDPRFTKLCTCGPAAR